MQVLIILCLPVEFNIYKASCYAVFMTKQHSLDVSCLFILIWHFFSPSPSFFAALLVLCRPWLCMQAKWQFLIKLLQQKFHESDRERLRTRERDQDRDKERDRRHRDYQDRSGRDGRGRGRNEDNGRSRNHDYGRLWWDNIVCSLFLLLLLPFSQWFEGNDLYFWIIGYWLYKLAVSLCNFFLFERKSKLCDVTDGVQ